MFPAILVAAVLLLAPLKAATPDEALWSPFLIAVLLGAGVWDAVKSLRSKAASLNSTGKSTNERAEPTARIPSALFAGYIAWAFLALAWQWFARSHGHPVYLDQMVRTFSFWLAGYVLATRLRSTLATRSALYLTCIALVIGATIASYIGLQDYLIHLRNHEASWREFATSTPDYFAGFLVMTIPLTLALFIAAPSRVTFLGPLLFGLALAPQVFVLPTTGSRFALISLTIGMVVFVVAFVGSRKSGFILPVAGRNRAILLIVVALLGVGIVAKPVLARLGKAAAADQAHSGQFRVYTWKGALHMAEANPVFGAGPGNFVFSYQKYAIVGYTRLAHSSYLQAIDEIGFPGFLLLAAGIVATLAVGARCVRLAPVTVERTDDAKETPLDIVAPGDDRLLFCGLYGGLAAGIVQNFIDSTWYVTFNGLTFWFLVGCILALASKVESPNAAPVASNRWVDVVTATVCSLSMLLMIIAGSAEIQAQTAADAMAGGNFPAARGLYEAAQATNPFRAEYPSALGWKIYPQVAPELAVPALIRAASLQPDAVNYRRVAKAQFSLGKPGDALAAINDGLAVEPNNVDLLNLLAQVQTALGNPTAALETQRRIAAIEICPIGTIRAITETADTRYAEADLAVGEAEMAKGNASGALPYFRRVEAALRQYADEGGSTNSMREAQAGFQADPDADQAMRTLYARAADNLVAALNALHDPSAADVRKATSGKLGEFDYVIGLSTKAKSEASGK